jgi:hypothetical protein
MKRKPKYLTRFCQICRGFSHRTIDCWLQERNKKHRPQAWKGQLAQEMIEEEAAEKAVVEEAMRILEECEGNGDEGGTADEEEGTADEKQEGTADDE